MSKIRFVGVFEETLLPVVDLRRNIEFLVVVVNDSLPVLSELSKVFDFSVFSVDFSVTLSSSASSVIVVMLFLCDLYFPPKKKQLVVLHEL